MSDDLQHVRVSREGAVAIVTLDRQDKFNAVNSQMHKDLAAVFSGIARDRDVRAVLLEAEGKAFCAGQDLTEFAGMDREEFRVDDHVRRTFNKLVLRMRALELPIIAAVNGVAAGAGASIALAADIRICSDRASFLQAFVKIGLVPDTGSTWLLPQLVGPERALELTWTGRPVDAEEAVRIGMATKVVPHEQLREEALAFATQLASMPTRAIGLTKRAVYRAATVDLADALEYEAQLQQSAIRTDDHVEGVMAFLEKREPAFSGR
jgi:2-(1,2-epoxy-1,2-dihydrophenyl)acetyl-CoA isomerase